MPIPAFDSNLVLPPHLGNPTDRTQLSPYPCTTLELCQRFAASPERRQILNGLLNFRQILQSAGFEGFQWLDGSFLEDVERSANRPPRDLDIVTLYTKPGLQALPGIFALHPILNDKTGIRNTHLLDHYFVDVAYNPVVTVELSRYWVGLFSHRRDGVWKGMLRLELNTPNDDAAAAQHLRSLP